MIEDFEEHLITAIQLLKERILLTTAPPEFVLENIYTARDIYENRKILRQLPGTNDTVSHIGRIILEAVKARKRIRTLDCLKVLRSFVHNPISDETLSPTTVHVLFEIYKHYIFSQNEELQWCVSSIVKNQILDDQAIDWLLANESKSTHIVNRLLLFPAAHPKIKKWAKRAYRTGAFPDRRSEVIALLIEDDLPLYAKKENSKTILWAIYKARIPDNHKIALINKYSDLASVESVMKIADRIKNKEIMVCLLDKLEAMRFSTVG